jgi:hypothetical protein
LRLNLRHWHFKPVAASGLRTGTKARIERRDPVLTRKSGPWGRLALRVTPAEVRIFWQGREVGRQSRTQLLQGMREWLVLERKQMEAQGFAAAGPDPPVAARGGLGLFVCSCVASFRNVTIEPLAGEH